MHRILPSWKQTAGCYCSHEHVTSLAWFGFLRAASLQVAIREIQWLNSMQPTGHERHHRKIWMKMLYTSSPSGWWTSGHSKIKQMRNYQNTFLTGKRPRLIQQYTYASENFNCESGCVIDLKYAVYVAAPYSC